MCPRLRNTVLPSTACAIVLLFLSGTASVVALGDQNAPELPGLFDKLRDASNELDAKTLENQIWQRWMTAPDPLSDSLMSQISLAMTSGEMEIALILCNQLVDSTPDFAEGWNRRATLHYLLGDDDSSVADIRETLIREPRHFGAISGLGLVFMRQNNLEAALDAFEQVLMISPGSASAKSNIELIRSELGTSI